MCCYGGRVALCLPFPFTQFGLRFLVFVVSRSRRSSSSWSSRVLAGIVVAVVALTGGVTPAQAVLVSPLLSDAGCYENRLEAQGFGISPAQADLSFAVDFFGQSYSQVWVNNHGSLTFGRTGWHGDLTSPFGTPPPTISPFYAPVAHVTDYYGDYSEGSGRRYGDITYGNIIVGLAEGYPGVFPAFCATWTDVAYDYRWAYITKRNTFQVVLVSRPDLGVGAFDIIFNYEKIEWETNSSTGLSSRSAAGAGYWANNGIPAHEHELPGSFVSGAFVDTSFTGLARTSTGPWGIAAGVTGRHVLPIVPDVNPWEVPASLYRPYPDGHLGYSFTNHGLGPRYPLEPEGKSWLERTGLEQGDVIRPDEMQEVFRDYTNHASPGWWIFRQNNEPALLDTLASHLNGGLCYGMALSAGRFDSGLADLQAPTLGRAASTWYYVPSAYLLPTPSSAASGAEYSKEMLRLLAKSHIVQSSVEERASADAQMATFAVPDKGVLTLRQQLISAMHSGRDLFDLSGKLHAASGTGSAILAFYIDLNREGDHHYNDDEQENANGRREWAHAVVVYSMREESDRTLVLGVLDNNRPGQPLEMRIMPDGSWTYNRTGLVHSQQEQLNELTLSLVDQGPGTSRTAITVSPLHGGKDFALLPSATQRRGVTNEPMLVDSTPGTQITVSDSWGRSVAHSPVPGQDDGAAGSTATVPDGAGSITVSGGSVLLRRLGAIGMVEPSSSGDVVVTTTSDTGTISLGQGSARLTVARGETYAKTEGVRSLTVDHDGQVTITADTDDAKLTISKENAGQISTVALLSGQTQPGREYQFTAQEIADAIGNTPANPGAPTRPGAPTTTTPTRPAASATPQAKPTKAKGTKKRRQKVTVGKRTKETVQGRRATVRGKVNTKGGVVRLQVRNGNQWRTVARAKVSRKGNFLLRTRKLRTGRNIVRIQRPKVHGYKAAVSRTLTITIAKRR